MAFRTNAQRKRRVASRKRTCTGEHDWIVWDKTGTASAVTYNDLNTALVLMVLHGPFAYLECDYCGEVYE